MKASAVRAVLRLASRDAWRHRGRSLLITLTLAFPVAGLVGAATLIHALSVPKAARVSWALGRADAMISPSSPEQPTANTEAAALRTVLATLPRGATAVAYRDGASRASSPGGLVRQVHVSDLPADEPMTAGMVHRVSGRQPRNAGEVTVSAALASAAHLHVGSTYTLEDVSAKALTVVGIADVPDVVNREQAWLSPGANDVAGAYQAQVLATVPGGADVAALQRSFGDGAFVQTRAALLAQRPPTLIGGTREVGLGVLVAGLALLEAVLMAGAAFAVGARRSQRDLALVGATGGDAGHVRGVVLSGGLVLGLVGGVAGTLLGLVAAEALLPYAPRLSHHVYVGTHPRLVELLASVAIGLATGLMSAWLPARGAARASIIASLTGRRGVVRSSASVTAVAIVATVAGTVIAAWAGRTSELGGQQINAVLFGAAIAELGFAGCAPALVGLAGRFAGHLPLTGRLSLRDIARNRTRTGPAVAAIMATLSGVVAVGVYVASNDARAKADYRPALPTNVVVLETNGGTLPPSGLVKAAAGQLPVKATADYQRRFDEKQAYVHTPDRTTSPRLSASPVPLGAQVTVADPALLTALGQPAAATAMAAGAAAVDPALIRGGTVSVSIGDGGSSSATRVLPAVAVQLPQNDVLGSAFISQATARALGLDDAFNTVALVLTGPAKAHDRDAARSVLLQSQSPTARDYVSLIAETGLDNGKALVVPLALLAISMLVTFGVTAISTALSASEGRPDLATLGAVGATPMLRRRLAMTQAAVLALLGGVLGILAGLVPMAAVIAVRSDVLTFTLPWQVIALSLVGVPVLAGLGAGLFTRSNLPLVRRLT